MHPDYEHEGIGEYLYGWVESTAHEGISLTPTDARIVLRAYTHAEDVDVWYSALLRAAGMNLIRHAWHMEMNLDKPPATPVWPNGITLKVFEAASPKRPIFEVRRETFKDQFGYVERPIEEHYAQWSHYWEKDEGYRPELWLMAMDGEKIVGINLSKASQNGDEDLGWVSSLGVLRDYRRQGIAEALLYAGFRALYDMGKKRVGLAVDASSLTGASALYTRAGMHITKQFDLYEKELRSGVDLTTHG